MAGKGWRIRAKRRFRYRRAASRPPAETRNWLDLPQDVMSLIFEKLGPTQVLWPAQAVCRPWRQLAFDPQMWRYIDMSSNIDVRNQKKMESIARMAVDRSAGHLEEFRAAYFVGDELLHYIIERTTGLKVLVLISANNLTEKWLLEFVSQCPLLEELLIIDFYSLETEVVAAGRACPELKRLGHNHEWFPIYDFFSSEEWFRSELDVYALAIAETMPKLRELHLIGNPLTNNGLNAILDNCTHLESLDIRECLNVKLDAKIQAKLARIKNVRLPRDSTADYQLENRLRKYSINAYPSGSSIDYGQEHPWTNCEHLRGCLALFPRLNQLGLVNNAKQGLNFPEMDLSRWYMAALEPVGLWVMENERDIIIID